MDGLLADAEEGGDLMLLEGLPVVEPDDLLLALGEDVRHVEERASHADPGEEAREVLGVDPTLLGAREQRLDHLADRPAARAEGADAADRALAERRAIDHAVHREPLDPRVSRRQARRTGGAAAARQARVVPVRGVERILRGR
ncbi:MAG: hypothetical protein ACO4CW_06690 [Planctomycetota bacterium]